MPDTNTDRPPPASAAGRSGSRPGCHPMESCERMRRTFETSDAVWRVGFRDDTRARAYVTDRAVRLSEDEFEELVHQLEEFA